MAEKLGDGNVYEGPRDLVIPSNPEKEGKNRVEFFLFRKIAHCLNSVQKPIRRYLNCFFLTPPNSTPTHSQQLPAKSLLSIGGILAAEADC